MDPYITNMIPAAKEEFGWDAAPPTVPAVSNMSDASVGFAPRPDGPGTAGDDTVPVSDPTDQTDELHNVPHLTDLSWETGSKGTSGIDRSGRQPGRSDGRSAAMMPLA